VALVERVEAIAAAKGCTSAQLAIAWALAQGEEIVPIPGTKRIKYLEQNLAALEIRLTTEELRALDAVTPAGSAVAGDRYQPAMMGYLNG
jgi:aryl-alcohol dehydrogenase-like predicted oxidoreductase